MSQPVSGYLYPTNLVLVKASTTVSGSADTTGVDLTQYDSNGITLIFPVSAVTGSGSLAIKVQESYDNVTYTDVPDGTTTLDTTDVGTNPPTTLFVAKFQGPYLRLDQTLTGTSVTYSCIAYGNPADATSSAGYSTQPVGQSL